MARAIIKKIPVLSLLSDSFISRISMVLVFDQQALIVTNGSKVYGIAGKKELPLNIASTEGLFVPTEIEELRNVSIKTIRYGSGKSILALTDDGKVYGWGSNSSGQLGFNTKGLSSLPVLCDKLLDYHIIDIACAPTLSVALSDDGKVFHTYKIHTSHYYSDVNASWKQMDLSICQKVVSINCGENFIVFLTSINELFYANFGDFKNATKLPVSKIEKVVCGSNYVLALTVSGTVLNLGGTINDPNAPLTNVLKVKFCHRNSIIDIAATNCNKLRAAIDQNLQVFIWGSSKMGDLNVPRKCAVSNLHEAMLLFGEGNVMHTPLYSEKTDLELSVVESLKVSINDPETTDLVITVENKEICVHKAILKIRSPLYRKMLSEPWIENKKMNIEHKSYDYHVYMAFLNYLYTGEVCIDGPINAFYLFLIADEHFLPLLKQRCADIVKATISISNVIEVFNIIFEKQFEEFERIFLDFMIKHMTEITLSNQLFMLPDTFRTKLLFEVAQKGGFRT